MSHTCLCLPSYSGIYASHLRIVVCADVLPQDQVTLERSAAVLTQKGPSVAVHTALVRPQVAGVAETPIAHRAGVTLLSAVHGHMFVQTSRLAEGSRALEAAERLFSAVNSAVPHQFAHRREPLVADHARERLFAGMGAKVQRQPAPVLETLSALGAAVLAAVEVHVLRQVVLVREGFLALGAQVGACAGRGVQDLVDFHVALRRKSLVAHRALIRSRLVIRSGGGRFDLCGKGIPCIHTTRHSYTPCFIKNNPVLNCP